jgi:hypothetical protein
MGQLNRLLTCVVAFAASYLGAYSAYAGRNGLPWSLGYEASDMCLRRLGLSPTRGLTSASVGDVVAGRCAGLPRRGRFRRGVWPARLVLGRWRGDEQAPTSATRRP